MDTETGDLLKQIIVGMDAGFARVDERFDQVDERFAQVDERFAQIDGRFAQVDERFAHADGHFAQVDGRFASLQAEMREGFRSVGERLTSIERDVGALWAESRAQGTGVAGLAERVASLTERMGGLEKRVDSMSDDMRQRFRTVIERLTALEHSHR